MAKWEDKTPTSIVNMGPVNYCEEGLELPEHYRSYGLSVQTSNCLAEHNKRGHPIDEFFWLDRKWLNFYTGEDKKALREVRELLGGFFVSLPLPGQCNLLGIPFFEGFSALASIDLKNRKKWISRRGLTTPEECIKDHLRDYFELILNDEGAHMGSWQIILRNMILEVRELNGEKMFPSDWGSPEQTRREHKEIIELARSMSDSRFFSLMEEQIAEQIRGSWWSSKGGLKETMIAAKSWGKDRLIDISEKNRILSGVPDLMILSDGHHTLLEVKTTDRMHQSQAHFVRNSLQPLELDVCLVNLEPSFEMDVVTHSKALVEFVQSIRNE
jgi:hypothetical protein